MPCLFNLCWIVFVLIYLEQPKTLVTRVGMQCVCLQNKVPKPANVQKEFHNMWNFEISFPFLSRLQLKNISFSCVYYCGRWDAYSQNPNFIWLKKIFSYIYPFCLLLIRLSVDGWALTWEVYLGRISFNEPSIYKTDEQLKIFSKSISTIIQN